MTAINIRQNFNTNASLKNTVSFLFGSMCTHHTLLHTDNRRALNDACILRDRTKALTKAPCVLYYTHLHPEVGS